MTRVPPTSDILLVYAPGSSPDNWPDGMAKFVPAGSDLVFQMHYTTNGHAASDQTSIGIVFAKTPPQEACAHAAIDERSVRDSAGRATTLAWKFTARCRTTRCCSAFFRTCICAESDSNTTSFIPMAARWKHRTAAARELRFLLADELPAGDAAAAEGRDGAASGRVVRQLEEQSAQSRSECRRLLRRADVR